MMVSMNVKEGDKVITFAPYHHNLGWSLPYAASLIGAIAVPVGIYPIDVPRAYHTIKIVQPQALMDALYPHTPFFMEEAVKEGLTLKDLNVKIVCHAGDVMTSERRKQLCELWGSEEAGYNNGGLGDAPALWYSDCPVHEGAHLHEDLFIVEVINPETGEEVGLGERGEYVLTSLWAEATPTIRWGTDDIISFDTSPCTCGRTHGRATFLGRVSYATRIGEKVVFPVEIENALRRNPETGHGEFYQFVHYAPVMDKLRVRAVYDEKVTRNLDEARERIQADIEKEVGVPVELELITLEELNLPGLKKLTILNKI